MYSLPVLQPGWPLPVSVVVERLHGVIWSLHKLFCHNIFCKGVVLICNY